MIKDLIVRLMEEANEEAEHPPWKLHTVAVAVHTWLVGGTWLHISSFAKVFRMASWKVDEALEGTVGVHILKSFRTSPFGLTLRHRAFLWKRLYSDHFCSCCVITTTICGVEDHMGLAIAHVHICGLPSLFVDFCPWLTFHAACVWSTCCNMWRCSVLRALLLSWSHMLFGACELSQTGLNIIREFDASALPERNSMLLHQLRIVLWAV